VLSFDYDPDAVATAQRLRDGRGISPGLWVIQQGSVLDRDYLAGLGSYDIVYSWGVLHHTGAMWQAIGNVLSLVAPGGLFALAIYNDQGEASRRALAMKQRYNRSGPIVRAAMLAIFTARQTLIGLAADVFRRRNPLERYRGVGRGMRVWYDIVDWVGGYPFEVATRNQVVAAVEKDGFTLVSVVDVGGGSGNNQFVFRRTEDASDTSDPSGSPASAE
jgi:SAM-dependent methyltransferase